MSQAYYHSTIGNFLNSSSDELVGKLNKGATAFSSQWTITTTSWDSCIDIVKQSFLGLIELNPRVKEWSILFEYEIPRLLSRIDIVIIAEDIIFVVEFKFDRKKYELADLRQVEDYVNDLNDFHLESRGKIIIPVLLAPNAKQFDNNIEGLVKKIECLKTNSSNFSRTLFSTFSLFHNSLHDLINPYNWEKSKYDPTPTIIQAAKALFAGQSVENITKSGADTTNLSLTSAYLIDTIKAAKSKNKKVVCFVTGVPGAGKTLVGLNVVHAKNQFGGDDTNTAYFSGNGPLINVLRKALSKDHKDREDILYKTKQTTVKPSEKKSFDQVKSKIQNLHQFIKDGIRSQLPPSERIVVFDEAQRCWNAVQFKNKSKQNQNRENNPFVIEEKSEAEMLFEFMSRHEGWSVIIALVGGGQEINTGEGGIREWGKALQEKYSDWEIHIAPQLLLGDESTAGQSLFDTIPEKIVIYENENLHLKVSQRSFKATNLNTWVNALIENRPNDALQIIKSIKDQYPLRITRDIFKAKEWLLNKKSGTKRIGLIASSGGLRLKPYGIFVREEIDEALWFLNDENDVRSSYYLETVATEYKVQGLEIDWACLCWDADLRRDNNEWIYKCFSGTKWVDNKQLQEQQFLLNSYRVLLTRAREGMVIFVPEGDETDFTRLPDFYNSIYSYLKSCGLDDI